MKTLKYAKKNGWQFCGQSKNTAHRVFEWRSESDGILHRISIGSGKHSKNAQHIDLDRLKKRIKQCTEGKCTHTQNLHQRLSA